MRNSILSAITALTLCLVIAAPGFSQLSDPPGEPKKDDPGSAQIKGEKELLDKKTASSGNEDESKAAPPEKTEKLNPEIESGSQAPKNNEPPAGDSVKGTGDTNENANGNETKVEESDLINSTDDKENNEEFETSNETAPVKRPSVSKNEKTEVEAEKKVVRKRRYPKKSFDDYVADAKEWCMTIGLQVLLIIVLTLICIKFTSSLSKRIFNFVTRDKEGTELKKRAATLGTVVRYLLIIIFLAIGGMMILNRLGVNIGPLLAGAGVLGIAVGFGAQSLVKDVISGAFILMEDQIRVGDVVKLGDKRGTVEKVTLRMVVLRDVSGNVHFIPSGDIQTVTNMTKTFSRYLFDLGVAYKEDTDAVIEEMKFVDEQIREDENFKDFILAPLEIMGVQRFESSAVIIRARIKTQPGKQWKTGREYNRRFKKRFDEVGIEIPYPHLTVYPGVSKDGVGPPLNIEMTEKS